MSKTTRILFTAVLWLALTPVTHAGPSIVLTAVPCFGQLFSYGVSPITIKIENFGRSVSGSIDVTGDNNAGGSRSYSYPIDLPSGTVKQITAYPQEPDGYSPFDVRFNGPVDVRPVNFDYTNYNHDYSAIDVGYVGDDSGGLAPLNLDSENAPEGTYSEDTQLSSAKHQGFYCRPETAPDRAIGYSAFGIVVLGEGVSRLTGDQWSAIRQWVIGGGSVLLLGGTGSLTDLATEGASGLCPLDDLHQSAIGSLALPQVGHSQKFTNVGLVTGELKAGAFTQLSDRGQPIVVSQHLGAGLVTLVTVNPLVQPISGNAGNLALLTWLAVHSAGSFGGSTISNYYSQFTTEGSSSGSVNVEKNPFLIRLPSFSEIGWIFLAYFVLAIPVTYLALRRIGRLELAWISTPIVSLLFAIVFYLFTSALYKAGLSHRTAGVLTAVAGDPDARFSGFSELFIPHGGTYDVAVPGSENLEQSVVTSPAGDTPTSSSSDHSLTTTDTIGGVAANSYSVSNLAFRRFYYSQPVSLDAGITATLVKTEHGITGRITNGSTIDLTNVDISMSSDGTSYPVGSVAAGQSLTVNATKTGVIPAILASSRQSKGINQARELESGYLTADFPAGRCGLQMGYDVSGEQSAQLLMSVIVPKATTK